MPQLESLRDYKVTNFYFLQELDRVSWQCMPEHCVSSDKCFLLVSDHSFTQPVISDTVSSLRCFSLEMPQKCALHTTELCTHSFLLPTALNQYLLQIQQHPLRMNLPFFAFPAVSENFLLFPRKAISKSIRVWVQLAPFLLSCFHRKFSCGKWKMLDKSI